MLLGDTRTDTKTELRPLRGKKAVDLFVCGPTVYDHAHIGHARTYILFDAFVKYLRSQKYAVAYVQNITDIDDKIIARARERGRDPADLAKEFEQEYYEDMKSLGIDSVSKYPRATDYIPQIKKQIEILVEKGHAYETDKGVYFEVATFPRYGELSGQRLDKLESQEEEPDSEKRHPADFALWKKTSDRPGWHIEDTAMTQELLGDQYDIHGGARDLIFPHHEAEIAQMESISDKHPLVNHWMHTGFLTVHGEKMAKSEGNFITIRDALKIWDKETFRLFILTKHYRSPIEYTKKSQGEFGAERARIEEFYARLAHRSTAEGKTTAADKKELATYQESFFARLDDDFDTPGAFATLFELISFTNKLIDKEALGKNEAEKIRAFLREINGVFGIANFEARDIPQDIQKLVDQREDTRKAEDWERADKLRQDIEKEGYIVKDTLSGPSITKI